MAESRVALPALRPVRSCETTSSVRTIVPPLFAGAVASFVVGGLIFFFRPPNWAEAVLGLATIPRVRARKDAKTADRRIELRMVSPLCKSVCRQREWGNVERPGPERQRVATYVPRPSCAEQ